MRLNLDEYQSVNCRINDVGYMIWLTSDCSALAEGE